MKKNGAIVVGVSMDSADSHAKFAQKERIDISAPQR